ncbi:MAG TPA: Ig-like domain-containing protein [Solirubrobacteraceae bacterium]|jgi:hypothetical protein|nr:Ig-like domain-containing protein [Solirubrobacteraceae bacterium]
MLTYRRISLALGVMSLALLLASACAQAAPITVNLRIEGSSKTLYEGPVKTEGETFETSSSKGPHPCDYAENGAAKGEFTNGGAVSGTPTTALRDAALASGLAFDAKWYGSGKEENENPGDFFVTQVGSDVELTEAPYDAWGYAVNDTTAPVGGCEIALAPGNEVLWAYNYFNLKHLLSLTGPASANEGSPVTVHVVDGQTGAPIAGATIGEDVAGSTTTLPGNPTTDAGGNATVTLAHTGTVELKATQPESVRSNAIAVCVHNGNEGACGTTPVLYACADSAGASLPYCGGPLVISPPPPVAEIAVAEGVKSGHVYSHRHAPRLLSGVVKIPAGGTLKQVRISLQRRNGKHCTVFSGTKEAFVRARCGATRFFSVGAAESFSYLLPSSLPPGHYVYDVEAINDSGNATKLVPGVSHVVFYVK